VYHGDPALSAHADVGSFDKTVQADYGEFMRNITVSLDDETYRRARMIAAERDTSVSALVKSFLTELASGESKPERLKRQERELRESITDFDASDRLSRDDVHRRGA
jgi:plasmid stability protein